MKTCLRINCFADRNNGDEYFCPEDRENWRRYCYNMGIGLQTPDNRVQEHLRFFQNKRS